MSVDGVEPTINDPGTGYRHLKMFKCLNFWLHVIACTFAWLVDTGSTTTVVQNSQQLVDAIRNATTQGHDEHTTLLLAPPLLSIQNVSLAPVQPPSLAQQPPVSIGSLLLKPQQPSSTVVLDTAMKSALVLPPAGYRLYVEDMIFFNLCEGTFMLSDTRVVKVATGTVLAILPRSPTSQSHSYKHVRSYLRHADVMQLAYIYMVMRTPFAQVAQLTAPLLMNNAKSNVSISSTTPYSLHIHHAGTSQALSEDLGFKSIDDPDDPFLQSMRDAGNLMPPQFCNGTLVPDVLLHEVNPAVAMWVVNASQPFVLAVTKAWLLTSTPVTEWRGPPTVLLSGTASLAVMGPDADPLMPALNSSLIVMGAFNDDPANIVYSVLDLGGQQGWLTLSPSGQFFIQHLTITGLASQPLPQLPGSTPQAAATISSALPLTIFNFTDNSLLTTPVVWMYNVTLQLPVDDYQALVALAAYGSNPDCQDAAITARAAQIQQGIISLQLLSLTAAPNTVLFGEFVGWGINATQLWISPSQPADLPTCAVASSCKGRLSFAEMVAVAVVSSICGGLLLAVACAAVLLLYTRKRAHLTSKSEAIPCAKLGSATSPPTSLLYTLLSHAQREQGQLMDATALKGDKQLRSDIDAGRSVSQEGHLQAMSPSLEHLQVPRASESVTMDVSSNMIAAAHASTCLAAQPALTSDMSNMVKHMAAQLSTAPDEVVVVAKLGAGSSGAVYQGVWKGLPVALKTLVFESHQEMSAAGPSTGSNSASAATDGSGLSGKPPRQPRAIMEAAIAASLGHRNVVCTYKYDIKAIQAKDEPGHTEAGGLQVVAMNDEQDSHGAAYKLLLVQELCHMSLERVLRGGGMLVEPGSMQVDFPLCLSVLLDVAQGLQYLHSKGVIHGDLKPDNVLLKMDGSSPVGVVAKLGDFGLSTHMGQTATHVSTFSAGTPFYVAPEVVLHHRVSTASDVFSFGVLMWQLCANQPPYIATGGGQFEWDPKFPHFQEPNIPCAQYQQLMSRCLQYEPGVRPTATELVHGLQQVAQSGLAAWVERMGAGDTPPV